MGSHVITASYGGDQNFTGSTSASYGESVVKASTSTTLQSSLNPSTAHTPVTLTAVVSVVSPGSGTPTGTITFMEGTIVIRRLSLDATGRATFGTSLLSVGSDTITAVYSDDDHFAASSSPAITQQVNPAPSTSTTLRSSLNPSTVHTSVTLTALVSVVAPGSGTPTGLIAFMDGTTVIGKRSLDATGRATFGTSLLSIGSHKITAVYSNATGQFAASSSPAITQQVNPAPAWWWAPRACRAHRSSTCLPQAPPLFQLPRREPAIPSAPNRQGTVWSTGRRGRNSRSDGRLLRPQLPSATIC